jgi:hypothetical protein
MCWVAERAFSSSISLSGASLSTNITSCGSVFTLRFS